MGLASWSGATSSSTNLHKQPFQLAAVKGWAARRDGRLGSIEGRGVPSQQDISNENNNDRAQRDAPTVAHSQVDG